MIPLIVILLFVSVIYFPVYSFGFINFDDNAYITDNPIISAGLTSDGFRWAFSNSLGGNWHPLSWLSHMLDVTLFGMNPGAFHLENVVLHAINGCLLYLILRAMRLSREAALCSSLLVVCHPLRMESVAWIAERKDVLSITLGMISIYLYLKRESLRGAFSFSVVSFALSLLAKPTLVTLPVFLMGCEIASSMQRTGAVPTSFGGCVTFLRMQLSRLPWMRLSPFLFVSLATSVLAIHAQSDGGGLRTLGDLSIEDRINTALTGYLVYLGKLLYPINLSIFYPRVALPSGIGMGAFVALYAITFSCWKARERYPQLVLGWAWFLITNLPMSGLLSIGGQFIADRWTYVPHIGLIVALVTALQTYSLRLFSVVIPFAVALLSILTVTELPNWESSETVFRHALRSNSENFMAHNNLGAALARRNLKEEALFHYQEAVRLNPTYPEALNNLGTAWAERGRFREALQQFELALKIRPDFLIAAQNRNQARRDLGLQ